MDDAIDKLYNEIIDISRDPETQEYYLFLILAEIKLSRIYDYDDDLKFDLIPFLFGMWILEQLKGIGMECHITDSKNRGAMRVMYQGEPKFCRIVDVHIKNTWSKKCVVS